MFELIYNIYFSIPHSWLYLANLNSLLNPGVWRILATVQPLKNDLNNSHNVGFVPETFINIVKDKIMYIWTIGNIVILCF